MTCSVTSGCAAGMPGAMTARRRGVSKLVSEPFGRKTFAAKQRSDALAQLAAGAFDHARGNFFATYFKQKVWH